MILRGRTKINSFLEFFLQGARYRCVCLNGLLWPLIDRTTALRVILDDNANNEVQMLPQSIA